MPYPSKAQHGEHKQKTNMQEQEHFVKESQKEQIDKSNNLSTNTQLRLSGNFWLLSFKISYLCLPLFYETRTTPSCHPSGCAYRQL